MGCFVAFIITTKGCAVNASFLRISAQKKRKTPSGRLLREGKILMMADGKQEAILRAVRAGLGLWHSASFPVSFCRSL